MKSRIISFLSILIPFSLLLLYVWNTATDLVFRDDMYMIKGGFIESYLKDNLTFADLWRPTNGMRIIGGALLHITTIKWFSMNSKIIVMLAPFLMLASAVMIYREYRKSLAPEGSPDFIAATFFVIAFIIFNVIQWEALIFANGIGSLYPIPFVIASFISLERYLSNGNTKYLPVVLVVCALTVLVFGGKPVFVLVPALGLTYLCYVLTRKSELTTDFWIRSLVITVFLALCALIYLYKIDYNDYVMHSSPYIDDLKAVASHPQDAFRFLLAAFGASIIGIDAFFAFDFLSFNGIVIIGFLLVLLYALALVLYFKSYMYKKTYLPFFLIIQTFLFLAFMTVGRFRFGGLDYGMTSRYTCISIYGLVSIVWIFIFVISRSQKPMMMLRCFMVSGFVMIFSGLLLTSFVELITQPSKKAYFEELRETALKIDTATPEELSKFAERPELVRESLRLLREYKMNVYREDK